MAVAPVGTPVDGDKRLDFKYDYRGRRVEKTYAVHNGSAWVTESVQRFVYDEWNVVLVLDDNNDTLRKYAWGLDLSRTIHGAGGIGGLLAVEETAEQDSPAYWFFYDANGNVGQVLKASDQTIAAKYEYDPYGNVVASGGTYADDNPIRFSTKWFDTELAGAQVGGAVGTSGLGYWGYRYYSPRLGRWASRDPIGEMGGLNLQQYAQSNPVNRADRLGLQSGWRITRHTGLDEKVLPTFEYDPPEGFWWWYAERYAGRYLVKISLVDTSTVQIAVEARSVYGYGNIVLASLNYYKATRDASYTFTCDKAKGKWLVGGGMGGSPVDHVVFADSKVSWVADYDPSTSTLGLEAAARIGYAATTSSTAGGDAGIGAKMGEIQGSAKITVGWGVSYMSGKTWEGSLNATIICECKDD